MNGTECKLIKNFVSDASVGEVLFEDAKCFHRQVTTDEQFKESMNDAELL